MALQEISLEKSALVQVGLFRYLRSREVLSTGGASEWLFTRILLKLISTLLRNSCGLIGLT